MHIRQAGAEDLNRIAEIMVFNYRINFYPIFKNDDFYFNQLQVDKIAAGFAPALDSLWVWDDGVIKGFIQTEKDEIKKLFVEPAFQNRGIGAALLKHAVNTCGTDTLWALEKNSRAIAFYLRHGFVPTGERKPEEDTTEHLIRLQRSGSTKGEEK